MTQYSYGRQPRNVISGSCADAKAAEARGALDADGKGRPGRNGKPAAGFTSATYSVDARYDGKDEPRTLYRCTSCGGGSYPTVVEAQSKCKKGLGSPTHNLERIDVVVRVAQATVTAASVEQDTWALEWQTDCPEGKRWNKHIRTHEARHRRDNAKVLESWRRSVQLPTLTGKGETEEERHADVIKQLGELVDDWLAELKRLTEEASEAFHRTPAGADAVLDCSKCP